MKIISYHGNLYLPEFTHHVAEIKAHGFDTILFCITETDMLYNLSIFKDFREHAEAEGLVCWATFWGLFAGEAVVAEANKNTALSKWLECVSDIGFTEIFIDEPKKYVSAWVSTLHGLYSQFNYHLCLADNTFAEMHDEDILKMPVQSLGVSNYHWTTDYTKIISRSRNIASRLKTLRPNDGFVFVQGFDIPEGMEQLPEYVRATSMDCGISSFGFWSFRCTAATGTKKPVNHRQIWESIRW